MNSIKRNRIVSPIDLAAIFDMDGLLIDSEPLWWQAGSEVLRTVGVNLEDGRALETYGMRTDAAMAYWFRKFPWTAKTSKQIEEEVNSRMIQILAQGVRAMPGVESAIRLLSGRSIPMGVCSSSPRVVINAVLDALNLSGAFNVVCSAEDQPYGKPHPGAYLTCARLLGISPENCVAFEDSLRGAIAAKAAEMKVVAVPSEGHRRLSAFDFCDIRLHSLTDFNLRILRRLFPLALAAEHG
jgi:HAD superfamily hydrolase (TIGR01509 family)